MVADSTPGRVPCCLKEEIAAMRAAGPVKKYLTDDYPIVRLVRQLACSISLNVVHVNKSGLGLTLKTYATAAAIASRK
jgi:hypothetical protein